MLPPDPARRRAIIRYFDTTIQMNRALGVLVVAERLQRQWLQVRLLFGEHRRDLSLGPWMRVSAQRSSQWSRYACASSRLSNFLPFSGVVCAWLTPLSTFSFSIRIAHLAGQRRHTVVRRNIAIQRVHARIVEVCRQYALAKVIQDHDPRRTAKPAKCLLMQLGPHPRTRTEDQQANTLPATTQC